MTANYEDKETLFNGKAIRVKRGQLITGRHSLNEQTGIHESKIVRILKSLEIEQQIEQQKTNRFTVITIVNYEEYNGQQNGQPMNNKRTHLNTLKDIKSKRLSQSNCTVTKY